MSTINVDTPTTVVGDNFIFNNDLTNSLYIEPGSRAPDIGSSTLLPLAGVRVDGTYRLSSLGKPSLSVDVLPGGQQRVASPLQISAAGTPGANILTPPGPLGGGITYNLPTGNNLMFKGSVAGYAGVLFRLFPTVGYCKVTLTWYIDAAFTLVVGSNAWRVSSVCQLIIAHPLRAQYLKIEINVTSILFTADIYLAPCSNFPNKIYYPIVATEIHVDSASIPASGTLDYIIPFIRPGLTTISCIVYDISASVQFKVRKYNPDSSHDSLIADLGTGVGANPAIASGSPAFPPQNVNVPDDIWGVMVQNNDTVNPHTFALHCTNQNIT